MSGYNPKHGRDTGPPPPSTQPGPSSYATAARPGYNPRHGYDTGPPPPTTNPTPAIPAQVYVPQPAYAFVPMPNVAYTPVAGTYPAIPAYPTQPVPVFTGTFPVAQPAAGPSFPLWSECMLPSEYCTMHIFNSTATPPWQFGPGDNKSFIVRKVPCIMPVKELMQKLSCTNPEPKKNKLYEIVELGNGKWSKGLVISGDDKDRIKKTIKEFGWDKSRTGLAGGRPVVWLWPTKG